MKNINDKYALLIILIITSLIYAKGLSGNFLNYDDDILIVKNTSVHGINLTNLKTVLTPSPQRSYQPVRDISYMLDYSLWEDNPFGYHLTNLLLYLVTGVVVFKVNKLLFPSKLISILTTLIFMIHPIHCEGVAWVSGRKEIISGLFLFLSLLYYLKSQKKSFYFNYITSLFFYIIAALGKASVTFLPFALLLIDYIKQKSFNLRTSILRILSYLIISGIIVYIYKDNKLIGFAAGYTQAFPLGQLISFIANGIFFYFRNILFPWNLAIHYSQTKVYPGLIISEVFLFLIITFLLFKYKEKECLLGWSWFWLSLIPTLAVHFYGIKFADRYIYLGIWGIAIIIAKLIEKINSTQFKKVIIYGIMIYFSLFTIQRVGVWQNNLTLWKDTVEKTNDGIAHLNYGIALLDNKKYSQSVGELLEACASPMLRNVTLLASKSALDAISRLEYETYYTYQQGEITSTEYEQILKKLSAFYIETKKYNKAQEIFKNLLILSPNNKNYLQDYASSCFMQGNYTEALDFYLQAVKVKPNDTNILNNLATCYYKLGKISYAKEIIAKILTLDPQNERAQKLTKLLNKEE